MPKPHSHQRADGRSYMRRQSAGSAVADPVGIREYQSDEENDDEESSYGFRERPREFFRRHLQNMVHFLVEDWFLSAMLGFITAILSISVDLGYEYLNHYRRVIYEQAIKLDVVVGFSAWVTYMVMFVGLGAIVCRYISKQAIGSGIPEVKVIMNGFTLQNYLTFRTLIAKMLSLVMVLGAGMPLGKEGPFVHMGAIVATLLSKITKPFRNNFYHNEGRDVEILSSGCAVGIACTFSAPAGAVLYGIESTHKYFAVKSYWRSFFAATCSALIFRFANNFIIPREIAGTITAYHQTSFPNEVFVVEEMPIFAFIGVLTGITGALFLILYKAVHRFQQRNFIFRKIFGRDGFAFTIFMAFVIALITFPDGFGKYIGGKFTYGETLGDLISNCSMSLYNTTSPFACSRDIVYRWTADQTKDPFVYTTLIGYLISNFLLVSVCITLAIPTGIFVPAFVQGACMGRLIGEVMVLLFPEGIRGPGGPQIYPGLYAVVGAAAYTGAVTHSLSIAVIVCETTGQLSPLLPVLIALMISNAVSSFLQPSIYESIIIMKKYPYLTDLPPSRISVHTVKVEQIMVTDVVYITKDTTYKELRELLISTPQLRSYPLVTDDEERILLGSVSRKYLNFLVNIHLGQDPMLRRRSSHLSDSLNPYNRNSFLNKSMSGHTLLSNSPLQDEKRQSTKSFGGYHRRSTDQILNGTDNALMDRAMKLDAPIDIDDMGIDSAPFQLVLGTSLFKVHTLFSLLGLNHAYVTHRGQLIGVVALRELRLALSDIYVRPARVKSQSTLSINKIQQADDLHKPLEIMGGKKKKQKKEITVDVASKQSDTNSSSSGMSIHIHDMPTEYIDECADETTVLMDSNNESEKSEEEKNEGQK